MRRPPFKPERFPPPWWRGRVLLGLLMLSWGCGRTSQEVPSGPEPVPTRAIPQGQPAPESGNRHSDQVPMQVLKAPGGQALALVPVYLEGQGPFSFALDTGASNSAVDLAIAQKLHLPDQGSAVAVSGVNKSSHAVQVAVKQWRVGDIPLPARILLATDMSALHKESGLQGLLGSDILSQFDSVTIDYQGKRLLLRHSR